MVSEKIKVSQNFGQISRVSQSRFCAVLTSRSLDFFTKEMWGLNLGLAIQRPQKFSVS